MMHSIVNNLALHILKDLLLYYNLHFINLNYTLYVNLQAINLVIVSIIINYIMCPTVSDHFHILYLNKMCQHSQILHEPKMIINFTFISAITTKITNF